MTTALAIPGGQCAEHPHSDPHAPQAAALQRECVQDLCVQLAGWAYLAARAAEISDASELLEVLRGARKTLIAALDEAKELVSIEGGGGKS